MALDDFRYIHCTSLISCSGIPAFCINLRIPSRHMLSKACLKSTKLMKTFCLCCMFFQYLSHCEDHLNCASSWPEPGFFFSKCTCNILFHSVLYQFREDLVENLSSKLH